RRGARLQSPYGLLTSRPASISRFRQVRRSCNVDFETCVMPPLRDAAGKARILTAIDNSLDIHPEHRLRQIDCRSVHPLAMVEIAQRNNHSNNL
ncbi:hypothetical protein, partial [Burkholderia sp. ABCPW 14]|uniref:hypothetical protein n=1 Tax=Burkholderia sp. ABCPW 14 TaxID=1637860 RepID=UPI001E370627